MCTRRGHRCICKMHKKVHWTCINHFLRAHPTRAHFEAGAMQFFVRFSSGLFFYFSLASPFRAVHINFSFHPLTLSNLWTSHIADAMLSAQHQKLIFFSRRKNFSAVFAIDALKFPLCKTSFKSRCRTTRVVCPPRFYLIRHPALFVQKSPHRHPKDFCILFRARIFPLKAGEQKKK